MQCIFVRLPVSFTRPTPTRCGSSKNLYKEYGKRNTDGESTSAKMVLKFGLKPTVSEEAVDIVKDQRDILIVHLHVDDSLICCDNEHLLQEFKPFIHSVYKLKWTESPTCCLGIKIEITNKSITLYQNQYIKSVLDRSDMTNCKSAQPPLPSQINFIEGSEDDIPEAQNLPFQQLVGCLQWLPYTTRPDFEAYTGTQVSRFNTSWTTIHWTMAKRKLRYLKGSSTVGIQYAGSDCNPTIYSDLDSSQGSLTRRSVIGYVSTATSGLVA